MSMYWVAYKGLAKLEDISWESYLELDSNEREEILWVQQNPAQLKQYNLLDLSKGLENNAAYKSTEQGWYQVARKQWEYDARLNVLLDLVGYDYDLRGTDAQGPFYELFSYGLGCIGAPVCAKLVADFSEWDLRAQAVGNATYEFYDWYCMMWNMFKFSAEDGAVTCSSS